MSVTDKKRELIISSAMRRFSHFGIHKTTMNEIAEDIAVTQPSLYYYFPDKVSLIIAVVEKIADEYLKELEEALGASASIKELFYKIIQLRKNFIERYFMLHLTDNSADTAIHEICSPVLKNSREREIRIVARFIETASKQKEPDVDKNADKTAALYLDMLSGLSMLVLSKESKAIMPAESLLNALIEKQQDITQIFLKGIGLAATPPRDVTNAQFT